LGVFENTPNLAEFDGKIKILEKLTRIRKVADKRFTQFTDFRENSLKRRV
jgi:hypothetical protein